MSCITLELAERIWRADPEAGIDLAIPLHFDGRQPRFFGASPAHARTLEAGGFIGDTQRGGSCNVERIEMVPHCNGTHTESVGHIVDQDAPVGALRPCGLLLAILVSIEPVEGAISGDRLEQALSDAPARCQAVIVRTLPNPQSKCARDYDTGTAPAYFLADAMHILALRGIDHVLVDLPSLDPMHDAGRLAAHRAFWGLPEDSRELDRATRPEATVTEMIFVPDTVADGIYLLDLQIPAFLTDAAPSRPIIYPLEDA